MAAENMEGSTHYRDDEVHIWSARKCEEDKTKRRDKAAKGRLAQLLFRRDWSLKAFSLLSVLRSPERRGESACTFADADTARF